MLLGHSHYLERKLESHMQEGKERNFSGGAVDKNPPANAGDTSSTPGLGRLLSPQGKPMLHNKRSQQNERPLQHKRAPTYHN